MLAPTRGPRQAARTKQKLHQLMKWA